MQIGEDVLPVNNSTSIAKCRQKEDSFCTNLMAQKFKDIENKMTTIIDTVPKINDIDKRANIMETLFPVLFSAMDEVLAYLEELE